MNRFEYLILSILEKAGSFSLASAMTVREITETEDYGYRDITDTGRELLKNARGE